MQKEFFGYIPYTAKIFEELWEKGVIILDANILLHLYRRPSEVRDAILNNLKELSDRIWLPHNTVKEFLKCRPNIIMQEKKVHNYIREKSKQANLIDELNKIKHLTLSSKKQEMIDIVNKCSEDLEKIISEDEKICEDLIKNDKTLEIILNLYKDKIGEEIDEKNLNDMKRKIDIRYEKKIPPGYADLKGKSGDKKYGDCINWMEIIKYAKDNKKDIIYITDDEKEDWQEIYETKKLGPRMELLQEFYKETEGQKIYIYNTKGFIYNFNKYINGNDEIKNIVIDEIQDINDDIQEINNKSVINKSVINYLLENENLLHDFHDKYNDYFVDIKNKIDKQQEKNRYINNAIKNIFGEYIKEDIKEDIKYHVYKKLFEKSIDDTIDLNTNKYEFTNTISFPEISSNSYNKK